jgi:hypothetical protein
MLYSAPVGNKIPLGPRLWSPLQVGGPRTERAPVHGFPHPESNRVAPDCMIMDNLGIITKN